MPTRRGFLSALLAGAATAATVDVDRLLWTPGKKLISIPAARKVEVAFFPKWPEIPDYIVVTEELTKGEFLRRYPGTTIPDEIIRPSPIISLNPNAFVLDWPRMIPRYRVLIVS